MQQRSAGRHAHLADPRALLRPLLVLAVAVTLAVAGVQPTAGDETDDAFPTQAEVESAEAKAAKKARDVGAIKAMLLLANQRLEDAAVRAEQASEAYLGAMWRLHLAEERVAEAQQEATDARAAVATQRRAIAALVAQSYQQAGDLTALGALMDADGPLAVLDQYAAFQGASTSLQAEYDSFAATDALARVFERQAQQARAEQERRAAEAEEAKEAAATAAEQAQAEAASIAAEKDRLIRELAEAQNISVELARERQTALEELARQRAAEQARREAEAAARAAAREAARKAAEVREQAQAREEAGAREQAQAREDARQREQARLREQQEREEREQAAEPQPAPAPAPPAAPEPTPAPAPAPAPSGSGGAGSAIAFAKAQLGEPYQWGAAGPDSWDCSGLMQEAWETAGVYLPHYSVAQYYTGTPIAVTDLRPGDLVFWGSSNDADSIFHVAMYIGDGQIIHAPRTGRPVTIDNMYYWTPPNFFARV